VGTGRVWRHPQQLGSFTLIPFLGATPVAVFLGFSLTAAITVAESSTDDNLWKQASLALFGLATLCLVLCLEWIVHAGQWAADPELRLAIRPEAKVDPRVLDEVRDEWNHDLMLLSWYAVWISRALTAGLACGVAAFGAALLAFSDRLGSQIGAGVAVIAILALALSHVATRRPFPERSWARERLSPGPPRPLSEAGWAAMFGGRLEAQCLQPSPARTIEELKELAGSDGIESVFDGCAQLLLARTDRHYTTAVSLVGEMLVDGGHRAAISLHLGARAPGRLMFSVTEDLARALHLTDEQLLLRLPPGCFRHPSLGWYGFLGSVPEFERLLPERHPPDRPGSLRGLWDRLRGRGRWTHRANGPRPRP
jgi:hypothetical protein